MSLPLELIVRVFRTYKGDIEKGIQGSIRLRNPETGLQSNEDIFTAKDATIAQFDIPTKLYADRKPIDLLTDLVTKDGRLEVDRAVSRLGPVLRLRPARLLHSPARRLAAVELRQSPSWASGCKWCS